MSALWALLTSLCFGMASSIVPLVNAEAYLLLSVTANPWAVVPLVLAVAGGQTAGKMLIFEAAFRGSTRLTMGQLVKSRALLDASAKLEATLSERRTAVPVVFVAATLGLPPLAVVSVASGSAHQSRIAFALTCFVGRTLRFGTLAVPALAVLNAA